MENQYGIAVHNKYDLFLDEDEDPLENLRKLEEEKTKKKDDKTKKDTKNEKNAKSAKGKKGQKPLISQQETKSTYNDERGPKKDDRPRSGNQSRGMGERKPPRDRESDRNAINKENKTPYNRGERRSDPTSPQSTEFRDRNTDRPESGRGRGGFYSRRGRGRGFGRGGFSDRGDREQGGFNRFGKRDYERHSGSDKTSGVKATEKREGGGAHNWGTIKDDFDNTFRQEDFKATFKVEQFNESNLSADETAATGETPANDDSTAVDNVEEETAAVEDPADKEMTLDEWKAQQSNQRTKSAFNIRKANEGVDDSQWKKMTVLKKKPVESDEEEEESDEEDDDYWDERRGRKKVDIEITFNDNPRRGGRGRRGRGDGRGRGEGRGRGGGGGGRGRGSSEGPRGGGFRSGMKEAAPRVDDENDFPSLVKAAAS